MKTSKDTPQQQRVDAETLEVQEAIESLARDGLIFDTGRRKWNERTGCYDIVSAATPPKAQLKHLANFGSVKMSVRGLLWLVAASALDRAAEVPSAMSNKIYLRVRLRVDRRHLQIR